MSEQWALEVLGYVASALVAISLMMSSILRLRLINLVGSAAFTVYGALIGAYPVAAVNGFIVLINLYYLYGMLREREYFRLLEVRPDSEYLGYFLRFYGPEIERFVPGFPGTVPEGALSVFVLRDMVPAGVFIADFRGQDTLEVRLDFVIPQYRDFKIARYLFREQAEYFRSRGVREIVSAPGSARHAAYLRRIGFVPGGEGEGYRLRLA